MKVVFLDMDGVLNTDPFLLKTTIEAWPAGHVDPKHVAILNQIMERTGAVLVLSSSWRNIISLEDLMVVLRAKGYTGPDFIGRTAGRALHGGYEKFGYMVPRSEQIQAWMDDHPGVEAFAILDDDWDAEIKGHFIRTSPLVGLTGEHVIDVLKLLGCLYGCPWDCEDVWKCGCDCHFEGIGR